MYFTAAIHYAAPMTQVRVSGKLALLLAGLVAGFAAHGACDPAPGVPGEDVSLAFLHDGVERSYVLHLPTGYDCAEPVPMVVGVHGYGGAWRFFENRWAGIFDHINQNGYIGLFPDGMHPSPEHTNVRGFNDLTSGHDEGPDGLTCKPPPFAYPAFDNCSGSQAGRVCPWGNSCADDLGYFRALITHVTGTWAVDASRVYMVGYSQGGSTVNGLAPHLADLLAAVAPMHGFTANGYAEGAEVPLPFLQVWGRADSTVSGDGTPSDDGLIYDSATATVAAWARAQGCSVEGSTPWPSSADGTQGCACTQHAGCAADSEVVSCAWDGAHVWPRDENDNFSWQVIWSFFEKHIKYNTIK